MLLCYLYPTWSAPQFHGYLVLCSSTSLYNCGLAWFSCVHAGMLAITIGCGDNANELYRESLPAISQALKSKNESVILSVRVWYHILAIWPFLFYPLMYGFSFPSLFDNDKELIWYFRLLSVLLLPLLLVLMVLRKQKLLCRSYGISFTQIQVKQYVPFLQFGTSTFVETL